MLFQQSETIESSQLIILDAVASRRIVDENVGDGADEPAILNDRTPSHG